MIQARWKFPIWCGLALAVNAAVSRAGMKEGTMEMYWVDSEGGGSTLIVTPAGESVLVDSGNPGLRDSGRILRVAKTVAGLERIDHLIVTHFHVDHFGGAAEVAAGLPVGTIWDNGLPDADPDGQRASTWPLTSKPYREIAAGARRVVVAGTSVALKGTAGALAPELRCYMARQKVWDGARRRPQEGAVGGEPARKAVDTSDNANSSAWVLSYGGFRFFDGGDLTWNAEATLVWPEVRVPEVDVYQVTHHGLDVSNHPRLLAALNPTVSVMNNGPTKGAMAEVFGTLRALPQLKAQYQVHRNVRPDGSTNNCGDAFIANGGATCAGDFIRCVVAADAKSYTISIPSRGHAATYVVRAKE